MPRHHEKSLKLTRTRSNSSTRRNSLSSDTSRYYLDDNDNEIFSGVGSEIVPSSIVTFHHQHTFEDTNDNENAHSEYAVDMASENNDVQHFGGHLINAPHSIEVEENDVTSELRKHDSNVSVRSRNNSIDSSNRANFQFFTSDQIENPQGVSSTIDDPFVDYDTNWNLVSVAYQQSDDSHSDDTQEDSKSLRKSSVASEEQYSSGVDESIEARESEYRARLLSDSSHESLNSSTELQPKRQLESLVYSDSKVQFQRFYIAEEDLVVGIAGYCTSTTKLYLYYLLNIATFGLSYLVLRWFPQYRINFYGVKKPLGCCDWVVVENEFGELEIIDIEKQWYNRNINTVFNVRHNEDQQEDQFEFPGGINVHLNKMPVLLSIEYRYIKLIYNPLEDIFTINTNWVDKSRWHSTHKIRNGLNEYDTEERSTIFGQNSLDLKEKSVSQLLVKEILHPFYIFQIFSIVLWLLDDYYYYAFCIFFISIISIVESLIETKQTMKKLKDISKLNNYPFVRVKRNGFWKELPLEELVPGDLFELSDPNLTNIPCDSILLSGDCIINESMLTGESVPVSKVPITDEILRKHLINLDSQFVSKNQVNGSLSKSFLFSGTKIIRVRRSQPSSATENDNKSRRTSVTSQFDAHSVSSKDNEPALALVVKVGFATTKGSLLRSMLFPKPTGFKLYKDAFKYIAFMSLVAIFGFIYSIHNFLALELETKVIVLRAFDIITIVVPPALPATLTIGTNFAINRLKDSKIFCISPSKVNICGKIDVFCFDKTGTLTEDGLDILGVHITTKSNERNVFKFSELIKDCDTINMPQINTTQSEQKQSKSREAKTQQMNKSIHHDFLLSMCSCHSLRLVDDECVGDPLDFKMFDFTKWQLWEDYEVVNEDRKAIYPFVVKPAGSEALQDSLAIIKSFDFVPVLRRMSVITKNIGEKIEGSYKIFTKGAPEVISEICDPQSLPENYDDLLYKYTHEGYRVIAVATKEFSCSKAKLQNINRGKIESNLSFLGFIIFENKLKQETKRTLKILNEDANIRTVMCTGDNVLTAISVAKESRLINNPNSTRVFIPSMRESIDGSENETIVWQDVNDPEVVLDSTTLTPVFKNGEQFSDYCLAVTGDIFRYILKNDNSEKDEVYGQSYVEKMLLKANIFARMSPDEKHELVEQLQKMDYIVGFCGDGANDCGALKAADVGISLSEAEASVAAPFTCTLFEISCVLDVIKEGRASLVTSFSCFKYMSLYSAIQFVSVSILYKKGSNLGDFQFLWIDLFLILPIAIFMSWSKPFTRIVSKKPSANLVSSKVLIPMVGNICIILAFQVFIWSFVYSEPWYVAPIPGGDDAVQSSDNTVLFYFTNFQYILVAILLTQGPPYRESSLSNIPFVAYVSFSFVCSIFLMCSDPDSWFGDLMQLTYTSTGFKIMIVLHSLLNLLVLWICDKSLFLWLNRMYNKLLYRGGKPSKKYFKRLLKEYQKSGQV